jgi:hypothetical protein
MDVRGLEDRQGAYRLDAFGGEWRRLRFAAKTPRRCSTALPGERVGSSYFARKLRGFGGSL